VEERSSEEDRGILFGNSRGKVKVNMTVVLLVQFGRINTNKTGWTGVSNAEDKSKHNVGLLTDGEEIIPEI